MSLSFLILFCLFACFVRLCFHVFYFFIVLLFIRLFYFIHCLFTICTFFTFLPTHELSPFWGHRFPFTLHTPAGLHLAPVVVLPSLYHWLFLWIQLFSYPEDGGRRFLKNVDTYLTNCRASHLRWQKFCLVVFYNTKQMFWIFIFPVFSTLEHVKTKFQKYYYNLYLTYFSSWLLDICLKAE